MIYVLYVYMTNIVVLIDQESVMPQLHLYVPEDIALKVQKKAKARNLTVSRYLAEVIKRDIGEGWPEGYFDRVCGRWDGEFPDIPREEPEELTEAL